MRVFHQATRPEDTPFIETTPGVKSKLVWRPIGSAGLYVPGGTAPLFSSLLMLAIPAGVAGVGRRVAVTPPSKDGSVHPAMMAAAAEAGLDELWLLGGAQAIAALTFGAELEDGLIAPVDKLFGPGNSFVTEAKQQVAQGGTVAIDMPAGPSEVLVIADAGADAAFVAADLLSQAEHGPDSQVILLSDDDALLQRVRAELSTQLAALPRAAIARQAMARSRLLRVDTLDTAFEISNRYAPEHLILALRAPRDWLDRVEVAGSVFLGDWTPEALGDYCSGTNHVLPTGGAARAWSGVSVSSFQNTVSVQSASAAGIRAIGSDAVTMARAEGLDAHANAVALRIAKAAA